MGLEFLAMLPGLLGGLGGLASGVAGGVNAFGGGSQAAAAPPTPGTPAPDAGGGLASTLGGLGSILGGISGIASPLVGLLGAQKEDPAAHFARRKWERIQEPAARVYEGLFYNPAMKISPYANQKYAWSPRQSTQQLYEHYLNREYGLPENVASALSSQALQPLRVGSLQGAPTGSSAGLRQAFNLQPGAVAQAGLGQMQGTLAEQQARMQSAQQLAQYNLWRSQQLGQLIG